MEEVNRFYCDKCKKEVNGRPEGVIEETDCIWYIYVEVKIKCEHCGYELWAYGDIWNLDYENPN